MTEEIKFLEEENFPYAFLGVESSGDGTTYSLIAKGIATRIMEIIRIALSAFNFAGMSCQKLSSMILIMLFVGV